jgi:hypothetical protein
MSLRDFIDEGFSISYPGPMSGFGEWIIWGRKHKLKEEFPDAGYRKAETEGYTKFHERMVTHFEEGQLIEFRKIRKLALDMYSYKAPVSTTLMRCLWKVGKVRRFVMYRTKHPKYAQSRGVHYVFLPPSLWKKRDMWEPIKVDGPRQFRRQE